MSRQLPTDEVPLILIPAAGYGTRVGRPAAKELLVGSDGRAMILGPLEISQTLKWPALVITREDKRELIEFIESLGRVDVQIQRIQATQDWPETILRSQDHWRKRNFVLLPDTEWEPLSILNQMFKAKEDVVIATHEVEDLGTWGVMKKVANGLAICEKPKDLGPGRAWGVFGFTRDAGASLLEAQSLSTVDHEWRLLNLSAQEFLLRQFRDLTRVSP